jgi:two-component system, sensor histidine kinase ChiS
VVRARDLRLENFCPTGITGHIFVLGLVSLTALTQANDTNLPADTQMHVKNCRHQQARDPRAAALTCQQAFEALSTEAMPELRMEMILRQSDAELALGELDKAQQSLELAGRISLTTEQWMLRYRLLRRQALLATQSNQHAKAKQDFQAAFLLAEQHQDQKLLAFSYNDLGLVARRQGDLRAAIAHFTEASKYMRQTENPDLAPTLSNLGDLYKDTGQYIDAENRYQEAFALFQAQQKPLEIAHTYERFALLAELRGETQAADAQLAKSYQQFADAGSDMSALRIRGDQLRVAIDRNDLEAANALARSLEARAAAAMPLRLVLQLARLSRLQNKAAASLDSLLTTVAQMDVEDRNRASFEQEIAEHYAALKQQAQANVYWRRALATDRAQSRRSFNQDASELRVALEVEENQRVSAQAALRTANAETQVRQANQQLRVLVASVFAAVMLLWFWLRLQKQRRLQRVTEAERAEAQAQLRYQRAEHELHIQTNLYANLLHQMDQPIALLDQGMRLQACTPSFARVFEQGMQTLTGSAMDQLLDRASFADLQNACATLDESDQEPPQVKHQLRLRSITSALSQADSAESEHDFELQTMPGQSGFLLRLNPPKLASAPTARSESSVLIEPSVPGELIDINSTERVQLPAPDSYDTNDFWLLPARRESLVEIMLIALASFERATGKTRIELAERSKLWRVTNDDGRLRVRAMDRYFSVKRMPRQPRWREVLRTGYYVLSNCKMDAKSRADLEQPIETLRQQLRDAALLGALEQS